MITSAMGRGTTRLHDFLEWRGVDASRVSVISDAAVVDAIIALYPLSPSVRHDISDLSDAQIAETLAALLKYGGACFVHWAHTRDVLRMDLGTLLQDVAKLWHPSSDDLFVLDTDLRPLVLIDHEEAVWVFGEGGEVW